MSKGIKPVNYTYGVGMEFVATSAKQVKDELKGNLDNLSKLMKQYNEALKLNPDADLSLLFSEMKKIQSLVNGIKGSENPFDNFVDKGVLDRVAKLESRLKLIESSSKNAQSSLTELKTAASTVSEELKTVGQQKFPGTFDNLFGSGKDNAAEIKKLTDQVEVYDTAIKKLQDSLQKYRASLDRELKSGTSIETVKTWVQEWQQLQSEMSSGKKINLQEFYNNVIKLSNLGQKLNAAQNTFSDAALDNAGLTQAMTQFNNQNLVVSKRVNEAVANITNARQKLNEQLEGLKADQEKYAIQKSSKSLGALVGDDGVKHRVSVLVDPKVNEGDWREKINTAIQNLGQFSIQVIPTVFNTSKNTTKEIEGQLSKITHQITANLQVVDNLDNFTERVATINKTIRQAKEDLEQSSTFKIRFDYDDSQNFKQTMNVELKKFKNIKASLYIANRDSFIDQLNNLKKKVQKEISTLPIIIDDKPILDKVDNLSSQLHEKLGNIDVNLSFKNAPQLLSQAKMLRDDIEDYYNKNPIDNAQGAAQGVTELSEKAKKAQEDIVKIRSALRSLTEEKFKSPDFLKLGIFNEALEPIKDSKEKVKEFLQVYEELLAKTSGTPDQLNALYGGGEKGYEAYEKDFDLMQKTETALNAILQSQIQYAQHKLELAQAILKEEQAITATKQEQAATEKKQPTTQTSEQPQIKVNKELAMSAEEATKKIRSLNGTLVQQRKTLKDLEANGIHSASFKRLGEWDKESGEFKKNSQDIQQLIKKYNELKRAREQTGSVKIVGEEASIRGKLSAILTQQKKHMSEIISKNQEELLSVKKLSDEYKNANGQKAKSTKTDSTGSLKHLNSLISKLNKANKAYQDLQSKQFDALGTTGIGDVNKRLQSAGSKQSFEELIAYYNRLIAKRDELEKAGQTNSAEYVEYTKAYQSIEQQLSTIYQDQLKYYETRIGQLDLEIKKERELLQVKQQQQQTTEQSESKKTSAKTDSTTTTSTSTVKLDGATLNTIAKDSTLQSISQKIDSILQQLNNGLVINGANVSINADSVAVANKDAGANVVMNSPNVQMSGANGSRIDLGSSTDINELYAKLQQFVQEHSSTVGLNHTKTKVSTDRAGNITGASISYASQDKLNGIVEYYKLVTDAETKTKSFQHASTVITENIESYEKSIVNAYDKQNKMATRYDQIVAGLEKSLDPNANKTLYGTQYEESLRAQINDIKNGVAELDKTTSGQRVLFSPEELSEQKRILDLMVIDAEKLISESKNEKYAPISFDSKNIESSVGRYKAQLQAFIEQTKRAGLYTGDFKQQVDALANEIETVKVGKDLKAYQNNLAIAKSDFASLRTYNKLYDDLSESIERQVKLKSQIKSETVGSNTKQQLELELAQEREISKNIIHQLQSNEQLYDINYKNLKVEEARQKAQQDIARSAAAQADKTINKQNNEMLATVESVQKQYDAMRNSMASLPASAPISDAMISKLKQYEGLLTTLKTKQQEMAANPNLFQSTEYKQGIDALLLQLSQVKEKFTQIQTASQDFLNKNSNIQQLDTIFDTKSADGLNQMHQAMIQYVDQLTHGQGKLIEFKDSMRTATFEVKNGKDQVQQLSVAYDQGTNSLGSFVAKTQTATSETQKFLKSLGHSFNNVARYLTTFGSVYRIFAMIRKGVTYVKEIDSALTELKKVTDATNAAYDSFLQTASKTAGVLGSTVSELVDAAADFARLGYSMREAADLAEAAVVYKNVGDGINDIATATESIISTMKAFGIEANNSMSIIDKFNEVGNNFAISSTGIGEAMQRSASALYEAGNTIDESIALVTAANSVIQNPEQVGTALKTLAMRLRGTKTELEEAGEDVDGMAESTSQLQAKLKALTHGKVDIMLDENTFKNTTEILREMSDAWEDMTDIERAAALELMGGKRQANILSSIIKNFDTVEDVITTSMDSAGSAIAENEKYLDSIQGKMDLFTNSVQTFWMNLISSDVAKGALDLATNFMKFLDTAHGKLITLIGVITLFKKIKSGVKFADMFTGGVKVVQEVITGTKSMLVATQSLTKAEIARALASKGVENSLVRRLIAEAQLKGVTAVLTKEQIANAAATLTTAYRNGELTASQYLATMSTMGLKTALQGLGTVLLKHPIFLVAAAVAGAALIFDGLNDTVRETAEAAQEAFEEITNVIDATTSTIRNLQSELSEIENKIDELNGKTLSFAEDQELQKLKEQREELEHSLKVQQQLLKLQRDAANKQAVTSMQAYTKAASEGAKETEKSYKNILTTIGVIGGTAIGAILTGGASLGVQAAGMLAGGIGFGIAGNKMGEAIGSNVAANDGTYEAWYDTYKKALETAKTEQEKALQEFQKDSGNMDKLDAWQEAQQKVTDIETEMYDHLSQMQQYASHFTGEELKEWSNFLDKFSIEQKASGAEVTALDRIFGDSASKEIKDIKQQILDTITAGQDFDFATAINGSQELKETLDYVGLSVEQVKNYFTQIGESILNPEFSLLNYANSINSVQESISKYQAALESLESGTFTMKDFIELIEEFPELAKGVDVSSKSFNGLSKNLKKAIKSSPDALISDLKNLRKQLQLAGKSTVEIDQLIESMENLPDDIVKDLAKDYSTLADEINAAKKAQNELEEAMNENPNAGYKTRGEAMEAMKEMMGRGEIGSESALWSIAKEWGFDIDYSDVNKGAEELANLIAIREQWFAKDDDDNYTFRGIEEFIKDVERAVGANKELASILKWNYNETTGAFDFDFDNKDLPQIIEHLSKSKHLLDLTTEEWTDLMIQVGQYFGLKWGDYDDEFDYLNEIATGASNAKTKVEEYGIAMQEAFGKGDVDLTQRPEVEFNKTNFESWATYYQKIIDESANYTDEYVKWAKEQLASINAGDSVATVYSSTYRKSDFMKLEKGESDTAVVLTPILPDGTVLSPKQLESYAEKILSGEEIDVDGITLGIFKNDNELKGFEENLHKAQEQYFELVRAANENPFSINMDGDNIETDIIQPLKEAGLKFEEVVDEITGEKQLTFDVVDLETLMRDNGYTTDSIMTVVNRLFGEGSDQSNLVKIREDILNIERASQDTIDKLNELNVEYTLVSNSQGMGIHINSNVDEVLHALEFTDEEIKSLKEKWESNGIYVQVDANVAEAEQTKEITESIPETTKTTIDVENTSANLKLNETIALLNDLAQGRTSTIRITTIEEKVVVETVTPATTPIINGRSRVNGTAYQSGSWGAPKTETALTGELGPELRVRGNRWELLGENGAEFADIQKGDIIFNHKQTEQLMSNGYVSSRGKAYASGTAYASGGGRFTYYKFNGDGTYSTHGVNDLPSSTKNAADEAEKFKETFDWVEVRLEEINEQLDLLGAKLENAVGYVAKNNVIDQMLGVNNSKLNNLQGGLQEYVNYAAKLLDEIPEKYREAAQDGSIAITKFAGEADEATVEAINNYREWAQKVADLTQQIEELESEIADLAKQKIDNIVNQFENEIDLIEAANDKLDAQISLMEDRGYIAAKEYYEAMSKNTKVRQEELKKEREAAQAALDAEVEAGRIKVGSDAWYDAIATLYDIDAAIVDCTSDLESYQNAINDIYWDNFDELINRYDYVSDEAQNLIDLMDRSKKVTTPDNEDGWAADEVEWTKEGIASLGLYAQQMEIAQEKSKEYAKAIEDLTRDYKDGKYSEQEYLEKLNELKNAQYDSIEASYDARDAIHDLNKARVDAIKNGIDKQVSAYEKLIKKQKESLDSEKDMADFQKSVTDKQKNIADIQRKLDALAYDNSISAAAKRKQLQAELAEAEYELEEMYTDRSYENKQNALDRELEDFQAEKEAEKEGWDKWLEDEDKALAESLEKAKANADSVYQILAEKSAEYGLTLSGAVLDPWKDGTNAISDYQETFGTAASSTIDQLSQIKQAWEEVTEATNDAARAEIEAQKEENLRYIAAKLKEETQPDDTAPTTQSNNNPSTTQTVGIGSTINASGATIYATSSGGGANTQYYADDPIYEIIGESGSYWKVRHRRLSSGVTGWFKKSDIAAYAKGTLGAPEDQFAWLDELGEELVMHADSYGRLSFITKGTSVIPADLTRNLMQLGELDPQDVLNRSRPAISAPQIINRNIELTMDIAEVVHIDTVNNDTIPNLTKAIDKQLDKYMKNLNNQVRKYSR